MSSVACVRGGAGRRAVNPSVDDTNTSTARTARTAYRTVPGIHVQLSAGRASSHRFVCCVRG
eukprot:scaffold74839_cov20-Prasinocladus_malaysianus.AAC.1